MPIRRRFCPTVVAVVGILTAIVGRQADATAPYDITGTPPAVASALPLGTASPLAIPTPSPPPPSGPLWISGSAPSAAGEALLSALRNAGRHGLSPGDYAVEHIEAALAAGDVDGLQTLLDRAFLRYAGDLTFARGRKPGALHTLLAEARKADDPLAFFEALVPSDPAYLRLSTALERYNASAAAGGWPPLPDGPVLGPGSRGVRVAILRARLAAEGDLFPAFAGGVVFDAPLHAAVQRFQTRHGLAVDGVVRPATRAALNVPAATRAAGIAANLERLRRESLPPAESRGLHVEVNVPAFALTVRNGPTVLFRTAAPVPDRAEKATGDGRPSVEKPLALAGLLLHGTGTFAASDFFGAVRPDPSGTVPSAHAVPVMFVYRTAWADIDGTVHFRPDVYGEDAALSALLAQPRPPLVTDPAVALD